MMSMNRTAEEQEADIKALSEQHGLTYYPPAKRDQIAQRLEKADALMRKNRAKAAASDRHYGEQSYGGKWVMTV
jgi:hypothetical protein